MRILAGLIWISICSIRWMMEKSSLWSRKCTASRTILAQVNQAIHSRPAMLQAAYGKTFVSCIITTTSNQSPPFYHFLQRSYQKQRVSSGRSERCLKQHTSFSFPFPVQMKTLRRESCNSTKVHDYYCI